MPVLCVGCCDLYRLVRCNSTFGFKLTECLHAPCVLCDMCCWSQPCFTKQIYLLQVSFIVGFLILHVTYCPPSLFPSSAGRVSSWMNDSAKWSVLLGLRKPFCLGWCSFVDWYHDLHCCYLCYTQLLFALGTDIFLAIDLKALTIIRLKQK